MRLTTAKIAITQIKLYTSFENLESEKKVSDK